MDLSPLQDSSPASLLPLVPFLSAGGALYAFAGYRLMRLLLALTGFALAGPVAGVIVGVIANGNYIAIACGALFGGICGAFALYFLYRAGIFLLGTLGGLALAWQVLHARPEPWAPWAIGGIALFAGLLALGIERPVMKLATAAIGASLMTAGAGVVALEALGTQQLEFDALAKRPELAYTLTGLWALLALLGAAVQFRKSKKKI